MTSEQLHHHQRVWTPRLLSATTILTASGVVLWFFVSNWILEIKASTSKIQTDINTISVEYEGRLTKVETRLDEHETRLARLER